MQGIAEGSDLGDNENDTLPQDQEDQQCNDDAEVFEFGAPAEVGRSIYQGDEVFEEFEDTHSMDTQAPNEVFEQADLDEEDIQAHMQNCLNTHYLNLDRSLAVPPIHHINDTATKGLGDCMPNYAPTVLGAQAVCKIIRKRGFRTKLLERCFSGEVTKYYADVIKRFRGWINTDRWATVAFSMPELIAISRRWRIAWSKAKFLGYNRDERDLSADTHTIVNNVDAFTEKPFSWAYCQMLEGLAKFLRMVTALGDSCPCHFHLFKRIQHLPKHIRDWLEKHWKERHPILQVSDPYTSDPEWFSKWRRSGIFF